MKPHILVLGAGFGGLELTSTLSDALGSSIDITLMDKSDAFVFGFSKLDVVFGRKPLDSVRIPYQRILKPGVCFRQETITAIDPKTRHVTTERGAYDADTLVVALGADYAPQATPGLVENGHEFYSLAGAVRLQEALPAFQGGHAVIGVTSQPFKCPPAPSEAALLLHDYLTARGLRDRSTISLVMPFGIPIPPSPETSQYLLKTFAERGIVFIPNLHVQALDANHRTVILENGQEVPCDLFLGIPQHCVPAVVAASGLAENGWVPVNPKNLETRFPGVYAVGDVTSVGTPKAGVFAEGAARVVAKALIARYQGGEQAGDYDGKGSCYVEFGEGRVGRIDVTFLSVPNPTGSLVAPTLEMVEEKKFFASSRTQRWFGD